MLGSTALSIHVQLYVLCVVGNEVRAWVGVCAQKFQSAYVCVCVCW